MTQQPDLNQLSAEQLRTLAAELMASLAAKDRALTHSTALNDKLTHELAILKRHKYDRRSEQFSVMQGLLLDELVDSDLAAIEVELEQAKATTEPAPKAKQQPKRGALPTELPRTLIRHEPDNTQCRCGCQLTRIGEDISEKLDYVPGVFSVERHIRGKWACTKPLGVDYQLQAEATRLKRILETATRNGVITGRRKEKARFAYWIAKQIHQAKNGSSPCETDDLLALYLQKGAAKAALGSQTNFIDALRLFEFSSSFSLNDDRDLMAMIKEDGRHISNHARCLSG